jgi:SAM-dependent methyltransferase
VNSEPTEDHLDRAKSRIRAEAEAARQRAPLPARISHASTAFSSPPAHDATQVSIAELARPSGREFIENAYRSILRRDSDPTGLEYQMSVLGSGAGKIEIIGDMRYSAEGRRNGMRIPGLMPRYLLSKLGRIPVLGAVVQWLIAAATLPHMLRYQRAMEASLAVRFDEAAAALRESNVDLTARTHAALDEQRNAVAVVLDEQRNAIAAVLDEQRNVFARLEGQQHALRQRIEIWEQDLNAVRQMVLSMNHWTVQVRKSIQAIDAAQAQQRASADEAAARIVRESRRLDAQRAQRLQAWSAELSSHLGAEVDVLDLCSGADWLAELTARRWRVNGIESNEALHRDSRQTGLPVAFGDYAALLARTAAQSLDALTIASLARIGEEMQAAHLLREAHRILKPNGCLLIGTEQIDAAENSATAAAARDAGFSNVRALAFGGGNAVIALLA